MRISVVTISFNQAEFLREAIDSVVTQSHDDIDYVVVDPGSTDGSREIVKSYGNRISNVVFERDSGPADGLNKGFALATGEFFGCVNADDKLLPGALARVNEVFTKNPGAEIVLGNCNVIDEKSRLKRKLFADPFQLRRLSFGSMTFGQPSVFFRRSAFEEVGGFNSENKVCWDLELMVDFGIARKQFQRVNAFLSCFRIHSKSITGSGNKSPKHFEFLRESDRLFTKAMGREKSWYDSLLWGEARFEKWLLNPMNILANVEASAIKLSFLHPPTFSRDNM